MPENPPTIPPYGRPMDQQPATQPAGIPQLQHHKQGKPLTSLVKKMLTNRKMLKLGKKNLPPMGKKKKLKVV